MAMINIQDAMRRAREVKSGKYIPPSVRRAQSRSKITSTSPTIKNAERRKTKPHHIYIDSPEKVQDAFLGGEINIMEANNLLKSFADSPHDLNSFQPPQKKISPEFVNDYLSFKGMQLGGGMSGVGLISEQIVRLFKRERTNTFDKFESNIKTSQNAQALLVSQPTPQEMQILEENKVNNSMFSNFGEDILTGLKPLAKPALYIGIGIIAISILPKLIGGK